MRIAVVTSFPSNPAAPRGGVEVVSVNLVRGLAEFDDLEVHVVTTDRECPSIRQTHWAGATVHRLPHSGKRVLSDAIGPGRRRISEYVTDLKPDVVHAHDVYGLMVKGLSIPRVFTIHGFIYGDTLVSGERFAWLRSQLWRIVETAGWADQHHIISISPYVRERLADIASGVIHDIDNPIAPEFFNVLRSERKGTLFSAALICPRKNPLALVEALAHVTANGVDARLRLAGSASHLAYLRRLEDLIRAHGLEDRVDLLGQLTSQQVRDELAAASAFVLASLEENSPMGIEEAMAAGVPVVTSNRCGMPYMVRDGESGFLVDPLDPADIAARLGGLLENDALRVSMGAKSREIALDRFHPKSVARRTREVYLRAMRSPRACNGRTR